MVKKVCEANKYQLMTIKIAQANFLPIFYSLMKPGFETKIRNDNRKISRKTLLGLDSETR